MVVKQIVIKSKQIDNFFVYHSPFWELSAIFLIRVYGRSRLGRAKKKRFDVTFTVSFLSSSPRK